MTTTVIDVDVDDIEGTLDTPENRAKIADTIRQAVTDEMDPIVLDGGQFARGWLNTSLACSADDERPVLSGVLVEVYDRLGVQLVATDSYMLLWTFVGVGGNDTDGYMLDESPNLSRIVRDVDGRAANLLKWVLKLDRHADKNDLPRPQIVLTLGTLESEDEPAFEGMGRDALVMTLLDGGSEREKVAVPIIDAEYPTWRNLVALPDKARRVVAFSTDLIGRFDKIHGLDGYAHLDLGPKPLDLVGVELPGSGMNCRLMPARIGDDE